MILQRVSAEAVEVKLPGWTEVRVNRCPFKTPRRDVTRFDRGRQAAGEERSGCTSGEGCPPPPRPPPPCPRAAPSPPHHDKRGRGGRRPQGAVRGPAERMLDRVVPGGAAGRLGARHRGRAERS